MDKIKHQARIAKLKLTGVGGWFRRHLAFSIVTAIVLVLFVCSIIFTMVFYRDKAAPGATIANTSIGGQTYDQIIDTVNNLINNMRLSLTYGGKSATASATDLGVSIQADKIAEQAVATGRGNPFSVVLSRPHFDLTASYDQALVSQFVTDNFPELSTDPVNPQIVYNDKQHRYELKPGAVGKSVVLDELYDQVEKLLAQPGLAKYEIAISDDVPIVSDDNARREVDRLNRSLEQSIQIVYNGKVLWTLDSWDIADWISFEPNPATSSYDVQYDTTKIERFIDSTVANQLPDKPVNEQAITNGRGETYRVITPGRDGRGVANAGSMALAIRDKLADVQGGRIELATRKINHGTDQWVASDGHWIEYNISTYEVRLYDGAKVVWSTNQTSNGKTSTPTITGLFKVWHKVQEQCMPNPPSTQPLCHIRKVTYFDKGGYAFHEAWWMTRAAGNVNKGISHGCINMYYEDAKRVFDWSSIGTPVWVHY